MERLDHLPVLYEMREQHVALITLNDEPTRNALSRKIVAGLVNALDRALEDSARGVVIAANGRTFCAGANIADLRDGWMEGRDPATDPTAAFEAIARFPRVVVAAIQGAAIGGGFELSLSCDLVVAEPQAWFALPELGHGVIPNTALARLPQVIGTRRSMELILTRRRVSCTEAFAMGLVSRVAEKDALTEAIALAKSIVANAPPGAIAAAKRNLNAYAATDWARVRASLSELDSNEWQEGLDAFGERRDPDFEAAWRRLGARHPADDGERR
ncbi:MAG: enoyl-CoA hydratase/isomerase family protein [Casimicrobiaceae bacterium]